MLHQDKKKKQNQNTKKAPNRIAVLEQWSTAQQRFRICATIIFQKVYIYVFDTFNRLIKILSLLQDFFAVVQFPLKCKEQSIILYNWKFNYFCPEGYGF